MSCGAEAPARMHCAPVTCCARSALNTALRLQGLGRRIPFAFLEDVKQRFESAYGVLAATAAAYEYNTEFSHTLQASL
jgi:hypothetical protein